jgi:acetyl-CoA C-acetyltransferase
MTDPIVIVGASRTAMGGMLGAFAGVHVAELGGAAISGALSDAGLEAGAVDELIMGCVLSAGLGQAPARQAGMKGGLGEGVPATTLNKMCGSGMKAVMTACDQLAAGTAGVVVAGGMENMSNAPYLLPSMRGGQRLGHAQAVDHMFLDGLEDAFDQGRLMGSFAEDCAERYGFTREAQDAYALESLSRATAAADDGVSAREITAVTVDARSGSVEITRDEQLDTARPEKIPHLKPAFRKGGTVTAANASSISDGAAALVLMRESRANHLGLRIRARVLGIGTHAQAPQWFSTAPIPAVSKLLDRLSLRVDDVGLWEINEAFAVVPMSAMHDLGIKHANINVHGGACALGHPIGASGARILVTLLNALETHDQRLGAAAVCIGGGEATAMVIERELS